MKQTIAAKLSCKRISETALLSSSYSTNLVIRPVLMLYNIKTFNSVSVLMQRVNSSAMLGTQRALLFMSSPASEEQDAERDGNYTVGDHSRAQAGVEEPLRKKRGVAMRMVTAAGRDSSPYRNFPGLREFFKGKSVSR